MPNLLYFVEKTHPILREIMPEVRDFQSPELQALIEDMCFSILPDQLKAAKAQHHSAAGMAANQWGKRLRVFIYTPDGSQEGNRKEVMINPSYEPFLRLGEREPKMQAAYEGCFSVPLATGVVNRYEVIRARYYDRQGNLIEKILEGWEARIFQHETDHLDGKLYDGRLDHFLGPDCIERISFKDEAERELFWTQKVRPSRAKNIS